MTALPTGRAEVTAPGRMCEGFGYDQPARQAAPPGPECAGAVDLSALAKRGPTADGGPTANGATAAGSGASSGLVIDVTDATFVTDVIQRSSTVPVVIDSRADWCRPCKQLSPVLERLAAEFAGRFLLAKVDLDADPQLGQAFRCSRSRRSSLFSRASRSRSSRGRNPRPRCARSSPSCFGWPRPTV